MSHSLNFEVLHKYDPSSDSISLPVVLRSASASISTIAKLDTGARFCVFQREHGEALDLEIENGIEIEISTGGGPFIAYGHEVTIVTLGYELDATVYFAKAYNFPRNILGRRGWIECFKLGIVDYDGLLYVNRYDDP